MLDQATAHRPTGIETHSIDFIPLAERHGKAWHQAPFWFAGNFVLITTVTGFIGPLMGLSLGWTILSACLGLCFGTVFVAYHANQGPRLGLPQMIQSRAQFGSRGAVFPFVVAVFNDIGFGVFNILLAAQCIQTVIQPPAWLLYLVLTAIAVAAAVYGYDVLHFIQRWISYVLIVVFAVLTVFAIGHLHAGSQVPHAQFIWSVFVIQFVAAAAFNISYAFSVSDYTRYLPSDVSARSLIGFTYLGMVVSAAWLMSLGALIASSVGSPDPVLSIVGLGNAFVPHFGTFVVLISVPALVSITAIEMYGGSLTSVSALDAFRKITPTRGIRVGGVLIIAAVVFILTVALPDSFLGNFGTFLTLLLTILIPWTTINLVDFYLVRKGRYDPHEILNPRGIYGQWAWRGITAYLVGLAAMLPFLNVSFFEGPMAKVFDGVDISFVVGIVVSGILFYVLCQSRGEIPGAAGDRAESSVA